MVLTDLLINSLPDDESERARAEKVFKILADPVEPVVAFFCKNMLKDNKNGVHIKWLTTGKLFIKAVNGFILKKGR